MSGTLQASRPRTVRRLLRAALWVLIAGLGAPSPVWATVYTWTGPAAGGSWTDPANWDPSSGFPNGATDRATIRNQGTATPVVIAIPSNPVGGITLQQLTLDSAGGAIAIVGVNSSLTLTPLFFAEPAIATGGAAADLQIQVPVRLAGDSMVFVQQGQTLTFLLPISDDGTPRAFTKIAGGTAIFASPNTYSGTTTVHGGVLRLTALDTIADAAKVDVWPGATFQPQRNETIGNLTITEGEVDMNGTGSLSVSSLDMAGGVVLASLGVRTLFLRGDVTATSTVNQFPLIAKTVIVDLIDATRTFTVSDGPTPFDLQIFGPIVGPAGATTVGVVKDGLGIMRFPDPMITHTYAGPTWVKDGWLILAATIAGDLRIGDGAGPVGQVAVHARENERIDNHRRVIVEADGAYELSGFAETLDQLTVNGGRVRLSTPLQPGLLILRALVMNAGTIDTGPPDAGGGEVRLRNLPDLEATSTATQTPIIIGNGRVMLEAALDVMVSDGPRPIDLHVDVPIVSTGAGLKKSGPGVARFTRTHTYTGPTTVTGGTLAMDGVLVSPIELMAGTVGGTGTAAVISATGGTIAPGASSGILNSGPLQLATGATFAAELNGTTLGTGYDQLRVTGTVFLSNATLAIAIGTGVTLPAHATFTIIDNDGAEAIAGTFANLAEGATAIGDRHAFRVSYTGGDGNDVVLTVLAATPPTPGEVTYYLAEGASGGFFDEDVLIANPNDSDAPVTLTFLQEGGGTIVERRTVPKQGRLTVRVDQIVGLENASPSVQIASDNKLPLIVERSMFWDASYYGGHTANAVAKPETRWTLAEGFQGFFDTYLLIANANATAATATVTFLRENDTPVVKTIPIPAFARKTIYAGEFSELLGRAFGIVVDATLPVIAERSMYFASVPARLWTGGHVNTGVTAPSTSWFHAEGATGGFFNTFILLSNPQTTEAHIELRFLLEDGTTIAKAKTLPAGQRLTVNPAAEGEPRLENAALSTIVASDLPIVSERSMYWPGDAAPFGEGHNSSGVVATATRWGLAEGRVGAPRNFTTYILLANPSTSTAEVTVTYLRETGAPITKTYTVQPTSRFNIDVAGAVPELRDESFGARIEVTNGVPIAVERSLYWDANGIFWAGGTNALATPLP